MIKKNEKFFFLIVLFLVTIKMIFVGSNSDEGYAIELCYRLAKGDLMITQMWEPHQTSAIFGAILVKLYWMFTDGSNTGIVLFLHFCGAFCQLGVAFFLYRVMKEEIPEHIAFRLAILYALCYPKGVIAPDYSNLQNWFLTLMVLLLILAHKKPLLYILVGTCLACLVLSYPSMILLYPVVLLLLWTGDAQEVTNKEKWKATLYITLTCFIIAIIFIGYLLSYASVSELVTGVGYILQDGSHTVSFVERVGELAYYAILIALRIAIYYLLAWLIHRFALKEYTRISVLGLTIIISLFVQILYWLFQDKFVNQPQTEIVIMAIVGLFLMKRIRNRLAGYMIVCSCAGLFGTFVLSNFKLTELVVYLTLAAIGGTILLCKQMLLNEQNEILCKGMICGKTICLSMKTLLTIWILVLAFGKVWVTSQGGEMHTTPFEVRNVQKTGPGIGIFTDYMTGHRYNTVAEQWDELVGNGESVFYVGPTSCYYMFGDNNIISAPNTISTPVYDENLFDYWEMFPERYPDVVLVESCYGESVYEEDSFIIRWLDTQYQATEIIEKEYVRVYRK